MEDLGRGLLPERETNRVVIRRGLKVVIFGSILVAFPCLLYILKAFSSSSNGAPVSDPGDYFNMNLVLLRDLLDEGLIKKGQKGFLLCSHSEEAMEFLRNSGVHLLTEEDLQKEKTVDFVFSSRSHGSQQDFNKILKDKGLVIFPLSNDPSTNLGLIRSYKIVYLRRFEKTVVAMRKTRSLSLRKTAAKEEIKKTILKNLEAVYLEPPLKTKTKFKSRKIKFLPDILKDSLDEYPRRVFISDEATALDWFNKKYPMKDQRFEFHSLEHETGGLSLYSWLEKNTKPEDYVVMKAEARAVEEVIRNQRMNLVDELFLECKNEWSDGDRNGRAKAYWECLALYGEVSDEGIAVHQWWN